MLYICMLLKLNIIILLTLIASHHVLSTVQVCAMKHITLYIVIFIQNKESDLNYATALSTMAEDMP